MNYGVLLASALLVSAAFPAQAEVLYVTANRMVDVASGQVVEKPAIVIDGDKIVTVGKQGSLPVPTGARQVDLGGKTLLPGLIDMHVHITSNAYQHGYESLGASSLRATLYGVKAARVTLNAGFTTVRDLGADHYGAVALGEAIADGDVVGPRIIASGPALGAKGGHCDNNLLPPEYHDVAIGVADGPWAIRSKVREIHKYGAKVVKFCATGGVLSKGDAAGAQQYTLEEMKALVDEAHMLGLKVAAHAHGTSGIRDAVAAGVDTIEHVSLLDDEGIKLAKQKGAYFDMDIYNDDFFVAEGEKAGMLPESLEKEKQIAKAQRDSFTRAFKAGVKMTFGTDGGVYPHGDNAKQFAWMVRLGMTPMQAIQSATKTAADALGMTGKVGIIAPGAYADLIAIDADPLANVSALEKVSFVMKGGEIVKSDSK